MTWLRIDDNFPECKDMEKIFAEHPKRYADCLGLWVAGSCYASRNMTDGFIPSARLSRLLPSHRLSHTCKSILLLVGLWEEVDGGIQIHNYLKYNPSKADILAKRAKETDRKRKQRRRGSHYGSPTGTKGGCPTRPIPSHPLKRLKEDERYESQDCKDTADTTHQFSDNPKPSLVWKIWEEEAGRPCGDMSYHLEHLRVILETCTKADGDTEELVRNAVKSIWDNFRERGKVPNPRFLAADISRHLYPSKNDSGDSSLCQRNPQSSIDKTEEWFRQFEADKAKWKAEQT